MPANHARPAAWLMPMPHRPEALAERAALIQRLRSLPEAMRALPQWLFFKLEQREGQAKPSKVPYYGSGKRRMGTQGDAADRAALLGFDAALARLAGSLHWSGLGFAFLPGDGLIGIDIDAAIDADGVVSERCTQIVERCASYTERSISGHGVHIIVAGETKTFKSNAIGVEVFCGAQFFTCTGAHWAGTPPQVVPIPAEVLQELRELVDAAKSSPRRTPGPTNEPAAATADLTTWLEQALAVLDSNCDYNEWIGIGMALKSALGESGQALWDYWSKKAGERYAGERAIATHWKSFAGSDVDGALTIFKMARKGSRWKPPAEWHRVYGRPQDARGHLQLVSPLPSGADARPEPPDAPPSPEGEDKPARKRGAAPSGGGAGKAPKVIDWDKFAALRESFALIYGTDTVWDGPNRLIMKIANMAHAHGSEMVRLWKGGKAVYRRVAGQPIEGRWTVMPENVVFDPSEQCDPETHINLFGGFALSAKQGDCGPILELITFLTSRAAENPDDCDAVKHYLLCWLAWPLQNRGAKLRTAVVMHGDEGAGKNFLTDLVVEIYGEYGATVGQDELEDKFNDWRSRKMLVVGDEVSSRAELVHNKNRLKALITSTTVQINPKNLPRREEANHINVWFNSNELQPLALDNSDRRYLVIFTPKAREYEFYQRLGEWKRKGGAAAFYHYLLEYECDGFDPFMPAPLTAAKKDLIDLNRKSPERFWIDWSEGQLDLPYRSCTLVQAYQAYLKYAQRTGDRFPLQRGLFTRMVLRISDTMGMPCTERVMKVDYALKSPVPEERATRMLLVTPPPEENLGAWATDCWRAFEPDLRRYCGIGSRFGDDDEGGPP